MVSSTIAEPNLGRHYTRKNWSLISPSWILLVWIYQTSNLQRFNKFCLFSTTQISWLSFRFEQLCGSLGLDNKCNIVMVSQLRLFILAIKMSWFGVWRSWDRSCGVIIDTASCITYFKSGVISVSVPILCLQIVPHATQILQKPAILWLIMPSHVLPFPCYPRLILNHDRSWSKATCQFQRYSESFKSSKRTCIFGLKASILNAVKICVLHVHVGDVQFGWHLMKPATTHKPCFIMKFWW